MKATIVISSMVALSTLMRFFQGARSNKVADKLKEMVSNTATVLRRDLDPAANFRKIDEIPFDFKRRRMSVVVAEHDEHHLLICKGAIEEMLSVCARHEKTA